MKYLLTLLASMLLTCARYEPHDPSSTCLERQLTPRARPFTACKGSARDPAACGSGGVVVEFYWKCTRWSSW